jgi:hypothetical protein
MMFRSRDNSNQQHHRFGMPAPQGSKRGTQEEGKLNEQHHISQRYHPFRRPAPGQERVVCELHVTTAELSEPVSDAMMWEPIPPCVDQTKLAGRLIASNLILTPTSKELRRHELQMECSGVSDFQLFRVKQNGEIKKEELRFLVRVSQAGAIALAENYVRLVGQVAATLKISYVEQAKLDLAAEQTGQEEARLELRSIATTVTKGRGRPAKGVR